MDTGNANKLASADDDCELIYDWQCPACSLYCGQIRLQDAGSRLHLVNARVDREVMREITAQGYDIDEDMYQRCRKRVLDQGNDTIREIEDYLNNFDVRLK